MLSSIKELEATIRELGVAPEAATRARAQLRMALREVSGLDATGKGKTLAEAIEECASSAFGHAEAASLLLRSLGVPNLIPSNNADNQIDRRVIALIRAGAPVLWDQFVGEGRIQTFAALSKITPIFSMILGQLNLINSGPAQIDSLLANRQRTTAALNKSMVPAALRAYDGEQIISRVETIFAWLAEVRVIESPAFPQRILNLQNFLSDELLYCDNNRTILTDTIYRPFLRTVEEAVARLDAESRERFICDLNIGVGNNKNLTKRYPINEQGREFTLLIPMTNSGPGYARAVTFTALPDTDNVFIHSSEVPYGDIAPGNFAFALEAMVFEPVNVLEITMEVTWGRAASPERQSKTIDVRVLAQPNDIDWAKLAQLDPYSTYIAEGDDFVGRRGKLTALIGRLTKNKMESSYITGQKRVGKSSLAKKLEDELARTDGPHEYVTSYLEWGEYANQDPNKTLENLGELLADAMRAGVEPNTIGFVPNFSGSLAPLNRLADIIRKTQTQKRFVFMLDEFDEIHPELYRIGTLADTFFSNLRSLSAKPNIALLLIGGEKMPFIISAQGDQLNKLVREHVDYFSRDEEWSDFTALVTRPSEESLTWHETALNALYNATLGHPYYTKLICKRIFISAVQERDTDVTDREAERAYDDAVSTLDTNAFAHLWRDGVQGNPDREEEVALQRCRLLAASARILRDRKTITAEELRAPQHALPLTEAEIATYLNEFVRRGIMTENGGAYEIKPPLFRDWLRHVGYSRLIPDTLGDELQARRQAEEQEAYVTPRELRDLIESWGTYQGQKISADHVRAWLEQVDEIRHQRLLFKLLSHLRFFRETEVRQALRMIHRSIAHDLPPFIVRRRNELRSDIIVTYLDGPGKSGAEYAALYAEENRISNTSVLEMTDFAAKLGEYEVKNKIAVNAVVIVDDILGSGKGLSSGITKFQEKNAHLFRVKKIPIILVVITAHRDGIKNLQALTSEISEMTIQLRICEPLLEMCAAFEQQPGIWKDEREYDEAKALITQLGRRVARQNPLGFGEQGLLVVFPKTCPNNSLPILHSDSTGAEPWIHLFRRPRN